MEKIEKKSLNGLDMDTLFTAVNDLIDIVNALKVPAPEMTDAEIESEVEINKVKRGRKPNGK
jgi:hypothetical protein